MKYHNAIFLILFSFYNYCNCDHDDKHKIEQAFKTHEVVPDVIDSAPSEELEIEYKSSRKEAKWGNELAPKDVREAPDVDYDDDDNQFYTLAMVDPDAPSRKNPESREFQHWLVVNIPGSKVSKGTTLSEYIGSGPPKDTGLHRYVFLVYKQPTGKINFNETHLDKHHTKDRRKFSIRKFADKYHLGKPIAGNFYQAQFDETVPELHKQFTD